MRKVLFILLAFFLQTHVAWGTHNRAGEITFNQVSLLTYRVQIVTYTKTSSPADRPMLEINWGDGTSDSLPRISKITVGPDISRNYYEGVHTYPGPSVYTVYFEDPNRNGGVVNIPGSVNIPFYVESQIVINPVLGYNNSPVLLQPPIDNGAVGKIFIHNPNAYDPDGDSLSYELIKCKGTNGLDIPGYFYPAASTSFTLDPVTGDLIWNTPTLQGEFNVAFLIREWRNGVNIGYVERDMQIDITVTNDNPPIINALNDLCVNAGTLISFNVSATDPDNTNLVTLSATGSPLDTSFTPVSPASFPIVTDTGSVTGTFTWQTECIHVRKAPYQILFKAQDNVNQVNLVDLKRMNITVVAPAPQNLAAIPSQNSIQLSWDQSACFNAVGYKIYRRNGFYGYIPALCQTGVPAFTGYTYLATVQGLTNTTFTDNNNGAGLIPGNEYCYMVIAYFNDGAESYASNEACAKLIQSLPIMTNVSVLTTDINNGSMFVAWSKPKVIDSLQTPGPFEYRLLRGQGFNPGSYTSIATFNSLDDTLFTDNALNTSGSAFTYKVEFYNMTPGNTFKIGESLPASSVFLTTVPSDNSVQLTWQAQVPWNNTNYVVYRQNASGSYVVLDTISTTLYEDTGLANDTTFCYKVETIGGYSSPAFVFPIINFSQEKCDTPSDNINPCTVASLFLTASCSTEEVTVSWTKPDSVCGNDVVAYEIYYSPTRSGTPYLIAQLNGINQNTFVRNIADSIRGCYFILTIDSAGNKSPLSEAVCAETCPYYVLPNVFTPDNDGKNDLFVPFPYRFVDHIELTVFNRWGNKVFETNDKDIKWKGTKDNGSTRLSDGVYYYVCKVYEIFINGVKPRTIHGGVQLIGGEK
jgi:gliding motility-associated-like protein